MDSMTRSAKMAESHQTTTAFGRNLPPTPAPRRCMALVPGSGTQLTDELHCLLRRRLRVAGLIGLAVLATFLVKHLVAPTVPAGPQPVDLAIHAGVVAILTLLCTLLWTKIPFRMPRLRLIELTLFGAIAAFFAYQQLRVFGNRQFVEWVLEKDHAPIVTSLATMGNSLRWFALIVLYGTFIPNTWRRCATMVGIFMITPLVLTVLACLECPIISQDQASATFDLLIVLAGGAAIAIFGSYRIQELQEEAFHARKLGQYRLLRKLGAGGMGEVYLAEHMLLRRSCAIKLIRTDQAGDTVNLSRFEREVQAMATLTHWNTVEVYDFGHAADGTFYYVMEYLPGLSLQELVDRYGPLPPARAIHFLRQVCAALREAHGVGLIHRDIKPSNVIACERGGVHDVAKLLDFGLVVQNVNLGPGSGTDKLTMQGTILGSPPYISPEQAMGKDAIDGRTDIYSLGALGYFLLTGQAPFVRDSAMELLVAHVHDTVPPVRELRPEVPHDLEEVLLKCLRKNPAERYAAADELDRALAACAAADAWDNDAAARWWKHRDGKRVEKLEAAGV